MGRRFRNAIKLSGLPHHKTLDEITVAFQPDLDPRRIRESGCKIATRSTGPSRSQGWAQTGQTPGGGTAGRDHRVMCNRIKW